MKIALILMLISFASFGSTNGVAVCNPLSAKPLIQQSIVEVSRGLASQKQIVEVGFVGAFSMSNDLDKASIIPGSVILRKMYYQLKNEDGTILDEKNISDDSRKFRLNQFAILKSTRNLTISANEQTCTFENKENSSFDLSTLAGKRMILSMVLTGGVTNDALKILLDKKIIDEIVQSAVPVRVTFKKLDPEYNVIKCSTSIWDRTTTDAKCLLKVQMYYEII